MRYAAVVALFLSALPPVTLATGQASAEGSKRIVLLAGTSTSPFLPQTLDGIADVLTAKGVKVKVSSSDSKARSAVLEEVKTVGAASLLYVTLFQGVAGSMKRGKLTLQCFDPDGKTLWEEEIKGSMGAFSQEGEFKGMLKNTNAKVEARIGGPGLPK